MRVVDKGKTVDSVTPNDSNLLESAVSTLATDHLELEISTGRTESRQTSPWATSLDPLQPVDFFIKVDPPVSRYTGHPSN